MVEPTRRFGSSLSAMLDDAYIQKAWRNAELEEIEDLAAEILRKAQEAQSIEDDLFCILHLAFRCGFTAAIGSIRISVSERGLSQ